MTFVLLLVATWLVLNVALFGAAAGLGHRRAVRESATSAGGPPAIVIPIGAR